MSAYGDIKRIRDGPSLPSTFWTPSDDFKDDNNEPNGRTISVHHLTLATARTLPGLLEYLGAVFAKEIDDGLTYPQEGEMGQNTFEMYFFAADVFVGIVGQSSPRTATASSGGDTINDIAASTIISRAGTSQLPSASDILTERGERSWEDSVAGYYYIKPNYPGRSSHICNAGFVVPPTQRKKGHGSLLSRSYVHYAPLLGYQASVFNLVYVNNTASVRLWEKLGFTKAGRIPNAGRLRTQDGKGEEYVDAWVIYKSFLEE